MPDKVPVWEKYTLSIEEAAEYFHIGENKLRRLASENRFAPWVLRSGERTLIKREAFEKHLSVLNDI